MQASPPPLHTLLSYGRTPTSTLLTRRSSTGVLTAVAAPDDNAALRWPLASYLALDPERWLQQTYSYLMNFR
jgi:hypothetical protein